MNKNAKKKLAGKRGPKKNIPPVKVMNLVLFMKIPANGPQLIG